MAEKIRVGIVGANVERGSWGAQTHVPALLALPDYELRAVCTAHRDTAEAAAAKFGAALAYDNLDEMVASPDIDMVAVCVRVPYHYPLSMTALKAGKHVYCEWPLGANTREAEELNAQAKASNVRTMVGLQGRGDPTLNYARDLIKQGHIGEVLSCNLTVFGGGVLGRVADRAWQVDPALGGNTLTIMAGHAMDSFIYVVGEFAELSGRLATKVKYWNLTDTGGTSPEVRTPDNVIVNGALESGAVASIHVGAIPYNGSGARIEVYGHDGTLVVTSTGGGGLQIAPNRVLVSKGSEPLAELPVPSEYVLVPEGTPKGSPYNVAQMYTRFADAISSGDTVPEADFDLAVKRHRFLDAIQRSSDEGRVVPFAG